MNGQENTEVRKRLEDFLQFHFARSSNFSRADMDELAMLTETASADLPQRFVSVVNSYDKKFSAVDSNKESFLDRVLRILSVQPTLPNPTIGLSENVGLSPTFSLVKKDRDRVMKLCSDMRKIVFA